MLSFKPKTNKTIEYSYTENMTLDQKHNSFVKKFIQNEKKISELLEKYNDLKNHLCNLDNHDIKTQQVIQKKINTIQLKINRIKNERHNYYLNNSEYIFKYFEEKKKIHNHETNSETIYSNKLDNFFNLKKQDKQPEQDTSKTENYIYKYMKNMDDIYFDIDKYIHPNQLCINCNKGEMIPVACDGVVVCNKCGIQHPFITDYEKPSYKEPPKEVCFYAYQRINHFREILAQFQAKETTQIPKEVLENIIFQIKKERVSMDELSYKRIKSILKNLGYNKYYEHIAYIKNKLGIKPPVMSQELEKTLCNLFGEIQNPYSKYCPNDRTNFLNYYYTVFKLCELLDQKEYLPLLKESMIGDRIKRIEQDNVWKKICEEMDWEFIPTE